MLDSRKHAFWLQAKTLWVAALRSIVPEANGDGPTYRAYAPGKGAASGITFIAGAVVVFVGVYGFAGQDDADALAGQVASAQDVALHGISGSASGVPGRA